MVDRRGFISTLGAAGVRAWLPASVGALSNITNTAEAHPPSGLSNPGIQFTQRSFEIAGRTTFLIAGEMHYFRTPKQDWLGRMELFKAAGGNCISTYIPWAVHEPIEGSFLFETGDGIHDLEAFLEVAKSVGLYVIARPGPYVGSELKYGGIPAWVCENNPDIQAQTIAGKSIGTSSISYLHPLYLEKARRWFQEICPRLARHTVQHGGPVAMVQLDNELMGFHIWRGSLDYNPVGMGFGKSSGRYTEFLHTRYNGIKALNEAYKTNFRTFETVVPLPLSQCSSFHDLRRAKDYLEFYLGTVAEYADILAGWVREHGIEVPLNHNSAGADMDSLFLEVSRSQGKGFLLGTDHYYNLGQNWGPNNPTPQRAVDIFCSLEMLRMMGYPPAVLEMQGGSPYDWPPIRAEDCAAWYWTNLAYGMKGSSYYIFTGGLNPPGLGDTSNSYDYSAAIGASGEIRPLYTVQKQFGKFLQKNAWLAGAQQESDFRVGMDFDAPRAVQYWKYEEDQLFSYPASWEFMRKGLLTSSFCAGLSPSLCDLGSDQWMRGDQMPLVVPASSCMATEKQERIVRFLQNGGRVLIAPTLPAFDDKFQPSTVLSDFLGGPVLKNRQQEVVRIRIGNQQNIVSNGIVFTSTRVPENAEILGSDELTDGAVAWQVETTGGGKAIFLGMSWSHAMRQHQELVRDLLFCLGVRPKVICSNSSIWTSLRTRGNRSAIFLMNLFTSPAETDLTCRPRSRGSMVQLGHHHLAPMSVKYIEL